jgi:sigma-B regulation protein RsbU (phosphoserine phosphatase)
MFTAAAKSAYRTARTCGFHSAPDRILATIDETLRGFSTIHTMSCCAMNFDLGNRQIVMSIGAHPAPLRFRLRPGKQPSMDLLDGEGPLLGDSIPSHATFSHSSHSLRAGDLILLYTDGIIEATDDADRMFGLRRLGKTVAAHAEEPLEDILSALKDTFYAFAGDVEIDDDVTVVLVRFTPRDESAS